MARSNVAFSPTRYTSVYASFSPAKASLQPTTTNSTVKGTASRVLSGTAIVLSSMDHQVPDEVVLRPRQRPARSGDENQSGSEYAPGHYFHILLRVSRSRRPGWTTRGATVRRPLKRYQSVRTPAIYRSSRSSAALTTDVSKCCPRSSSLAESATCPRASRASSSAAPRCASSPSSPIPNPTGAILRHFDLSHTPPRLSPALGPPRAALEFDADPVVPPDPLPADHFDETRAFDPTEALAPNPLPRRESRLLTRWSQLTHRTESRRKGG